MNSPNVVTSQELERAFFAESDNSLQIGGQRPQRAAFILCVGLRDPQGFTGCSRYCCPTAIKQALQLAERGIDTTIFYRDIRTISTGAEEMYRAARGQGVLFVRVPPGEKPRVIGDARAEAIRCYDDLLARELEVPTDLVVLSVGMRARQPETSRFHDLLKPSLGLDGFFLERHPELAPVETAVEGVLLAGTVQRAERHRRHRGASVSRGCEGGSLSRLRPGAPRSHRRRGRRREVSRLRNVRRHLPVSRTRPCGDGRA